MLHTLGVATIFFTMVCAPALVCMKTAEHLESDELLEEDDCDDL